MQINLLPEQLNIRKSKELKQDLKALALRFVYIWLILGILWIFLSLRIGYFKKKLSSINVELKTTESLMKEADILIKRKTELNEFLAFLKGHVKKGVFWSEKLKDLSRLIPAEAWLNEISLKKETKEGQENTFLDIFASVGYLKSDEEMLDKINNFIEQLKKDSSFFKDFDNLSLSEITKGQGKEKFMNFRFSLSLKQEQ